MRGSRAEARALRPPTPGSPSPHICPSHRPSQDPCCGHNPLKELLCQAPGCEWHGSEDTPLAPPPPLTASSLLCPLQTVEPVDQLLRKVDPAKDRELWVREHKTGNIRPVDMEI